MHRAKNLTSGWSTKKNVLDPSAVFVLFDVAVLDKAWARGYTRIGGGQLGAVRDG